MELEEYRKVFEGREMDNHLFREMDASYLFTNENLKQYMPDLCDKSVLAVTSSGDHYFNCLINGAKRVDLFDINKITIFVLKLKKSAIEVLELDEFLAYFNLWNSHIFSYEIYQKLREHLEEEVRNFWDYIYSLADYKGNNIIHSDLILEYHDHIKTIAYYNPYLQEPEFKKLKSILTEIKQITFYHSDINDLDGCLNDSYDEMFLSNIQAYQPKNQYLKIVKRLSKYLNEKGKIYFAYLFNYGGDSRECFYDQLLKSEQYREKIIIDDQKNKRDKVYIYQK